MIISYRSIPYRLGAPQASLPVVLHGGGLHSSLFHLPHFLRLPWTSRLHVARSSLRLQPHQQPPPWQASSGYPGLCGSVTAQASPEEPLCHSVLRLLLHIPCQYILQDPWQVPPPYWLFLAFVASATYISLVWGAFCFLPLILALKMLPGGRAEMSSPSQTMWRPFLPWPSESHTQKPGGSNPLLVNTAPSTLSVNQGPIPGKIAEIGYSAGMGELDQHQGNLP